MILTTLALLALSFGQTPENKSEFLDARPIPPPGVEVGAGDRQELEAGIQALGADIDSLRASLKGKPALLDLLPDVQIFHNAARYALTYGEFFKTGEIGTAKSLLQSGMERARLLRDGQAPWTTATGLVVRGYVSRLDGSVQPYGLVVPASYNAAGPNKHRLDIWFHGRGENLSEVNFLNDRMHNRGEFTPPDTFVLHPYGRFCNANRFAGEMDTLEALEAVKKLYPIDPNRVSVRGFSMGGASCWLFGTHYAGDWFACAPGAGFSETTGFLNLAKSGEVTPWYQQKLWHWYDSTDYAVNLANCPTVAYSGENDGQKQAADKMTEALAKEGITLVHIIGPKAGHWYAPSAKPEINRRMDALAAQGRTPVPASLHFTTWTLRYNHLNWLTLNGLEHHWERARTDAEITPGGEIRAKTANVSALTLAFAPGECPLDMTRRAVVILDGQKLTAPAPLSDRSLTVHFRKTGSRWTLAANAADATLHKRHNLQGPIDDAFLDSFVMVSPTGKPLNDKVGAWCTSEEAHAVTHWRRQFRGEARVKTDAEITDDDIANSNLILWGDPQSNRVLARIADRLPLHWDAAGVRLGTQSFDATHTVPVLIYPNPLNPNRYIVLNSGFTFREFDYLNNARQTPKLPDWAMLDANTPRTSRTPAQVTAAGFFDERWQYDGAGPKNQRATDRVGKESPMSLENDPVLVESPPSASGVTPALLRRVTLKLIPFLWFLYVIAYLDRVNVGFAKITMQPDLKFSEAVYGFGGGIFFVGYFLFEIPSNLLMEKVGARRWIARIMVTWGLIAMAMIFTHDKYSFYGLRFLLGIAEAGFYPGVILYLTYWFSAQERGRMVGWFMTATMIANIFGSPMSGALLGIHGWGLKGWQWLFIIEGLPAVALAFIVLAYLPNGPEDARWLSSEERAALLARREAERRAHPNRHASLKDALANPRLWTLTLIYFCMTTGQYGVTLWLPQIVKEFKVASNFVVGLLTAIPYIAAAFGVVLIGAHSDKTQERRLHVAIPAFVGATGLALSAFLPSPALRLAALALAAVGMWGTLGGFWSLPITFLQGTAAAGGIAFINALGNLGGFAGPYAIGAIKTASADINRGTALSLLLLAFSMTCAGLIALSLKLRSDPGPADETTLFAGSE